MRSKIPRYGSSVESGPITASVSIDVTPLLKHVSEFISLRSSADYLELGLLPRNNALKELTESMAAFNAVRNCLGRQALGDESITLFDIGCGHTPRTAALFAFRSKWTCVAIDPVLDQPKRWQQKVQRLTCAAKRIEDVRLGVVGELAVVALVHAHARVVDALRSIDANRYLVVAIPCCIPHELPGCEPDRKYKDYGCLSPQREVKVWDLSRERRDELVEPVEVLK